MCLLHEVQVLALLPEPAAGSTEVGFPPYCKFQEMELSRRVDYQVGPQVCQYVSGQGVGTPRQVSHNCGSQQEMLLEVFEKDFQNTVMMCVVSATLQSSLAVTEYMCQGLLAVTPDLAADCAQVR